MAPLMELKDEAHPNLLVTRSNASSPFLKIPLEIRITIYEIAVAVEQPIHPRQVAQRSNKFDWRGDEGRRRMHHFIPIEQRKEQVVVQLAYSCRQVYHELESYPVFYRVNKFGFHNSDSLLTFLAAITPERRGMLRSMLTTERIFFGRSRKAVQNHAHAMALLSRCKDLRSFEYSIDPVYYWHPPQREVVTSYLKSLLAAATSSELDVWSLPRFHATIVLRKDSVIRDPRNFDLVIDLRDPKPIDPEAHPGSWIDQSPFKDLVAELKKAIVSKQGREAEADERGEGFAAEVTDTQLHGAIVAAGVDFPGEDRIGQDTINSAVGAIATRTRGRCGKVPVSEWGTIERTPGKYSTEGLLTWTYFRVLEIRWNGSAIECKVVETTMPSIFKPTQEYDVGSPSWEPIHALITEPGETYLHGYYKWYMREKSLKDPASRLEEVNAMPFPKQIRDISDGFMSQGREEYPREWKGYIIRWKILQQYFEKFVKKLQDEVDTLEKAAEEDAMEAQMEAAEETKRVATESKAAKKRKASSANTKRT
ncbi:hypothetical protein BJ170DRAFT_729473 [Xylariales sp. AK1849]|nr:hypothetical protein BJ170DRAFT_729473 [Xylariales sp. AK1849]